MQELRDYYSKVIKAHGTSPEGKRKVLMAAQIMQGAEKGEISMEWAVQTMRKIKGSAIID